MNAKNRTNFDESMQETLLNNDETNNNFGQTNEKYYTIAWEKIQTDLNLIPRQNVMRVRSGVIGVIAWMVNDGIAFVVY